VLGQFEEVRLALQVRRLQRAFDGRDQLVFGVRHRGASFFSRQRRKECQDPSRTEKTPRRVIVPFARALIEGALYWQLDEPAAREHRIGGKMNVNLEKQHRRAVTSFNRVLGTPSLTAKAIVMGERVQNVRCRQPEGSGSSGKLRPKSITVTTGPPSGFRTSPRLSKKCQPTKAGGSDERDASNQDVSSAPRHSKQARIRPETPRRGHCHVVRSEFCSGHITTAPTRPSFKSEVGWREVQREEPRQETRRVAIVTGAAGGIGRAMTRGLLAASIRVAAVDRDREPIEALAASVREQGKATELLTMQTI
jgi:short chain dehydrogenase